MIYFKEYVDYEFGGAVKELNIDVEESKDELVNVQYQVIRYESTHAERTYILAQWRKVEDEK